MATFRERDSGYWQAIVRRKGYADQSKTFVTKADAEIWARSIEVEMDRGVFVSRAEAESTTLKEALERYEREVTPKKRGAEVEKYRIRAMLATDIAKRTLAGTFGSFTRKAPGSGAKRPSASMSR